MNDISKLPRWAQDHFTTLQKQRNEAVATLQRYLAEQTPSAIWQTDFLCTSTPPTFAKRYIQGDKVEIEHAGVHLEVLLARKDDPSRHYGISLQWDMPNRSTGLVAFVPRSFQSASLIAKENL